MMKRTRNYFIALLAALIAAGGSTLIGLRHGAAQDALPELDMNAIFRCFQTEPEAIAKCDEARGLILNNCTLCHIFVPIVLQQFEPPGWQSLIDRHRIGNRVDALTDEQVKTIQDYLTANFNPDHPPPDLPAELLENWTSY